MKNKHGKQVLKEKKRSWDFEPIIILITFLTNIKIGSGKWNYIMVDDLCDFLEENLKRSDKELLILSQSWRSSRHLLLWSWDSWNWPHKGQTTRVSTPNFTNIYVANLKPTKPSWQISEFVLRNPHEVESYDKP